MTQLVAPRGYGRGKHNVYKVHIVDPNDQHETIKAICGKSFWNVFSTVTNVKQVEGTPNICAACMRKFARSKS